MFVHFNFLASQAGDADSSRAPGLTSGLQGSVNVHRGTLWLVPQWQWQCISSFVFYTSIYPLHTIHSSCSIVWSKSTVKVLTTCRYLSPIAEWLEGHAGKQGVAGSIPSWGIHYHFEFFANGPLFTSRRRPYKWNQAWHSSRVMGAQR